MLNFRSLVQCLSSYDAPSTSSGPIFTCAVDNIQFRQSPLHAKNNIFSQKRFSSGFSFTGSSSNGHCGGSLQLVIDDMSSKIDPKRAARCMTLPLCGVRERVGPLWVNSTSPELINYENILADGNEEHSLADIDVYLHEETDSSCHSEKSTTDISDKEIQRRQRIGLANKGRTPWNKGRKHSEETRARIKKKTIEALRDPKVRKKMSECPRSHSDQSKARISSALRRIWDERLKHRRLKEKCYQMWAGYIAEAARKGAQDQQELHWDSYEKLKSDIMFQYLQWKADKARAKEIAKVRAETAAKVRAEHAAELALQKKDKEEKAKAREMRALARKKLEEEKKKMALSKGLKVKVRLTKFHRHTKQPSFVGVQREMAIEPQLILDVELIKVEKMRRKVSLADQIRAAKNRKAKFMQDLTSSISVSCIKEEAGDL